MAKVSYSAIGVDLSVNNITLAQLKWDHQSPILNSVSQSPRLDYTNEEAILKGLKQLLATGSFKGKKAVITLPTHHITTIPLKYTLKEDEEVEQAILREAVNYLPFSLEESVLDHLSLPNLDGRAPKSTLLIAAKKEEIVRYINLLHQAKLDVRVIEPRYCSLLRAIQWLVEERMRNHFIFYLGEHDSIIMVVVDEKILIVREIAWGVTILKKKIEKKLGLSEARAEQVLFHYGVGGELSEKTKGEKIGPLQAKELYQVIYEITHPLMEELCLEIQKVISYSGSLAQQRIIDRGLLLGYGDQIKSLDKFIQQRIGIKINSLEHAGGEMYTWFCEHPFGEVALGLALRKI